MKPVALLLAVYVCVVLRQQQVTGVHVDVKDQWDIAPLRVIVGLVKDLGHEGIAWRARNRLEKDKKILINKDNIKDGVRYNDMPGKDGSPTNLVKFGIRFSRAEKDRSKKHSKALTSFIAAHEGEVCAQLPGDEACAKIHKELKNGLLSTVEQQLRKAVCGNSRDGSKVCLALNAIQEKFSAAAGNSVARSHVGCMQTWHSMSPVAEDEQGYQIVFTNGDVLKLIKMQLRFWWDKAVSKFFKYLDCTIQNQNCDKAVPDNGIIQKIGSLFSNNKKYVDDSDKIIGHMAHTLQDSFAPGHTLRDATRNDKCGQIWLFQGYTMQHGNKAHGEADHNPDSKGNEDNDARRRELQYCAERYTAKLFDYWATSKKSMIDYMKNGRASGTTNTITDSGIQSLSITRFPTSWFMDGFSVADEALKQNAGGTVWFYSMFYSGKKSDIKAEKFAEEPVRRRQIKIRFKPVETKLAGSNNLVNGGQHLPFAECQEIQGDECSVDIHEAKYRMGDYEQHADSTKPVVIEKGVLPAVTYRDFYDFWKKKRPTEMPSICGGTMSAEETKMYQDYFQNTKRKQLMVSKVYDRIRSAKSLERMNTNNKKTNLVVNTLKAVVKNNSKYKYNGPQSTREKIKETLQA